MNLHEPKRQHIRSFVTRIKQYFPKFAFVALIMLMYKGSIEVALAYNDLSPMIKSAGQDINKATEKDFALLSTCTDYLEANTYEYTPKWRECMMSVAPKITTDTGAMVAAVYGYKWMHQQKQNDEELLSVLTYAVDSGWRFLEKNREYYEKQERLHKAILNVPLFAFFMAFADNNYGGKSIFDIRSSHLDRAEVFLHAPLLIQRQEQRNIERYKKEQLNKK